jgi:hypothetical protein
VKELELPESEGVFDVALITKLSPPLTNLILVNVMEVSVLVTVPIKVPPSVTVDDKTILLPKAAPVTITENSSFVVAGYIKFTIGVTTTVSAEETM